MRMGEERRTGVAGGVCSHTGYGDITVCMYMAVARAVIQRGRFAGDPGARSASRGRIECRRDDGGGGGGGSGGEARRQEDVVEDERRGAGREERRGRECET